MAVIYRPKGAALEYAELAANIYMTCSHGCRYCYGPGAIRKTAKEYFRPAEVKSNLLERLRKDAGKLEPGDRVHLCFIGDPYPASFNGPDVTRDAIEIIKGDTLFGGRNVQILTKGGTRATRDYDLLGSGDRVGATLTFINPTNSLAWEPGAALPEDRLEGLRQAKAGGLDTWVSLEPVIDPVQALELIRRSAEFVDFYYLGAWNHDQQARELDYREFCQAARELLEGLGKDYRFKESLTTVGGK